MVNSQNRQTPLRRIKLENSLVIWDSVTTADGDGGGMSLFDSSLIGYPDFISGKTVVQVYSGNNVYDKQIAAAFDNTTGEITFTSAMLSQVLANTPYRLLNVATPDIISVIVSGLTVPAVNSPDDILERDVIGNKGDAAVTVPSATASQIAYLKGILNIITTIAGGTYWNAFGPVQIQVGNAVTQGVTLFDPAGGIIPVGDITAGTYTIDRIRAAVQTNIVPSTASSKMNGAVYESYNYPGADWADGDLAVVTLTGIVIVVGGVTTSLPPIQIWTRLVMEPDIETTVNTINTNQGDPSGDTLTTTTAKLGNSANPIAPTLDTVNTNQGDPSTDTLPTTTAKLGNSPNAIGPTLDTVNTNQGDPSGDTLISTTAKLGNFIRSLTTELGARWDVVGDLGTDIATILANLGYVVIDSGTFTTSDAANPADVSKAAKDTNFYRGTLIMPVAGVIAGEPRIIRSFTTGTGTYHLDVDENFTQAPGLVDYVIIAFAASNHLPSANSTTNQDTNDVIGNKSDNAVTTVGIVASIIAYVKGLLSWLALTPKFGTVTEGTLLMTGAEQTVYEDVSNKQGILSGWINVNAMAAANNLTVKLYVDINDGAGYILHASDSLSGVQSLPAYMIADTPSKKKIKVTVQQTDAAYITIGYQFSRRSES